MIKNRLKSLRPSWLGYAAKFDAPVENEVFFKCRRAARAAHRHASEDRRPGESAYRDARAGAEVRRARTADRNGNEIARSNDRHSYITRPWPE